MRSHPSQVPSRPEHHHDIQAPRTLSKSAHALPLALYHPHLLKGLQPHLRAQTHSVLRYGRCLGRIGTTMWKRMYQVMARIWKPIPEPSRKRSFGGSFLTTSSSLSVFSYGTDAAHVLPGK